MFWSESTSTELPKRVANATETSFFKIFVIFAKKLHTKLSVFHVVMRMWKMVFPLLFTQRLEPPSLNLMLVNRSFFVPIGSR